MNLHLYKNLSQTISGLRRFSFTHLSIALIFGCAVVPASAYGAATASPSSITWGSVAVGSAGGQKVATLTNSGTAAISISSIGFTGTNAGDFAVFSRTCGSTLAASASCTANIIFKPTASGTRTATLNFSDSATGSPQHISVTGLGTGGSNSGNTGPGSVSPNPVNFGSVAVGGSASSFADLYDSGTSTIGAVTISITGTNAGDFAYSSNGCYAGVASKKSCKIGLQFTPKGTGTRTATLNLTDNASNSPQHATLTGTGTPANNSTITITPSSPSSFSFGSVSVGATSSSQTFTLTASGGNVSISNIAVINPNVNPTSVDTEFPITNKCSSSLPSGTSCTVSVAFKPSQIGNRVALLSVTDSGHDSPQLKAISGVGAYSSAQSAAFTVNFNNRSGGMTIPSNVLGTEYLESLPTNTNRSTVAGAGFTRSRYRLQLENVFPTSASSPSWGLLDSDMAKLAAANPSVTPIVMIEDSPKFLSSSLSCPPTNPSSWAQLAAQVATHLETTHPHYVQYYEIWNEPNTTNLCGGSSAARAAKYIPLYAAAAPAIKNAAAKVDGAIVKVGGPATAGVDADFAPLLTNASTKNYVDFYSYHFYVGTGPQISSMGWDTGTYHLHSMILDSGSGVQRRYMEAVSTVNSSGLKIPIFYDEYNDDWGFVTASPYNECCRNNPTYSPLYNSMVVAQLLNSAYHGANQVPSNMIYFAAAQISFCILGVPDAAWDCQKAVTGAQALPYPQWYTYNLMFGSSYLDLVAGGHMATSISPSSPTSQGLIATAYYTPTADGVLIINPTASRYSKVTLQINNPAKSSSNATLYIINSKNPQINSWPAHMLSVSGGLQTTFDVPGYSVIAVSLK